MSKPMMNSRSTAYPTNGGGAGTLTQAPGRNAPGSSNSTNLEPKPTQTSAAPASVEAIRKRAYEIYLSRAAKGQPGNATSDWVQAERELLGRR